MWVRFFRNLLVGLDPMVTGSGLNDARGMELVSWLVNVLSAAVSRVGCGPMTLKQIYRRLKNRPVCTVKSA
jgi:hypothetical protein